MRLVLGFTIKINSRKIFAEKLLETKIEENICRETSGEKNRRKMKKNAEKLRDKILPKKTFAENFWRKKSSKKTFAEKLQEKKFSKKIFAEKLSEKNLRRKHLRRNFCVKKFEEDIG